MKGNHMTFTISMTHKFDKILTDSDKVRIDLGAVEVDFITLICDDGNQTRIFDLPFNSWSSYKNNNEDIEVHLGHYCPDDSNTDEFDWNWAPHIKEAYYGDIHYYRMTKNDGHVDIDDELYDYLTNKYGIDGADDHFVDCIIYNENTGEKLSIPNVIHD